MAPVRACLCDRRVVPESAVANPVSEGSGFYSPLSSGKQGLAPRRRTLSDCEMCHCVSLVVGTLKKLEWNKYRLASGLSQPPAILLSPLSLSLPQESPRWGTLSAPFALYQQPLGSPWEVPGKSLEALAAGMSSE